MKMDTDSSRNNGCLIMVNLRGRTNSRTVSANYFLVPAERIWRDASIENCAQSQQEFGWPCKCVDFSANPRAADFRALQPIEPDCNLKNPNAGTSQAVIAQGSPTSGIKGLNI